MNKRKYKKALLFLLKKYERLYTNATYGRKNDPIAEGQYYAIIYAIDEAIKLLDNDYLDAFLKRCKTFIN